MFKRTVTPTILFGMLALAPPAATAEEQNAQRQPCAERATVTQHLERRYGEAQVGFGLRNAAAVMEIWASKDTGTWTILMTRADGVSCIVSSGQHWNDAPEDLGEEV